MIEAAQDTSSLCKENQTSMGTKTARMNTWQLTYACNSMWHIRYGVLSGGGRSTGLSSHDVQIRLR